MSCLHVEKYSLSKSDKKHLHLIDKFNFFYYCLFFFIVIFGILAYCYYKNTLDFSTSTIIALGILVLALVYALIVISSYSRHNLLVLRELEIAHKQVYDENKNKSIEIEKTTKVCNSLLEEDPFKGLATLHSDFIFLYHDWDINWLKRKQNPAFHSAELLRKAKEEKIQLNTELKIQTYKLEFLLYHFPELNPYLENFESLMELAKYEKIQTVKKNFDYSRDYLSKEEWERLSVTERNQLALERYVKKQKTPWQIGRDFEMFCAWHLEQKGFKVERFGIENGKKDLGRDLIAIDDSETKIYVIQCKCWKKDRLIRENIIAQLYGTSFALEQEMKNNLLNGYDQIKTVIPVIAIPTFSRLSNVAIEFCKKLGVQILILDYHRFPRIKCNINGGQKIYHLPFDQQYDSTKISKPGEFYAYNVKEAEEQGFRRALKHYR